MLRSWIAATLLSAALALAPLHKPRTRRNAFWIPALVALPTTARADLKTDCIKDCTSNCNRVAPGNKPYCGLQCDDYCAQDDREDGLSGSVSSEGGEVGLTSYARAGNTVPAGDDVPPKMDILPKAMLTDLMRGTEQKDLRVAPKGS